MHTCMQRSSFSFDLICCNLSRHNSNLLRDKLTNYRAINWNYRAITWAKKKYIVMSLTGHRSTAKYILGYICCILRVTQQCWCSFELRLLVMRHTSLRLITIKPAPLGNLSVLRPTHLYNSWIAPKINRGPFVYTESCNLHCSLCKSSS